ncbi:hypothetical protein RB7303 [Rhodopirellula baltica SH 1]|uniref:Uncharacterized protein n=1 Tax=Rhodopirellula baltica (strain DSM 10527 / NCIMB 13988 / SH1) TaxID=243090 RepID=Q7UNW5_RHOBA|nr:hypothetical protein RB7303 [Rhodopirellula baltica SH 1]
MSRSRSGSTVAGRGGRDSGVEGELAFMPSLYHNNGKLGLAQWPASPPSSHVDDFALTRHSLNPSAAPQSDRNGAFDTEHPNGLPTNVSFRPFIVLKIGRSSPTTIAAFDHLRDSQFLDGRCLKPTKPETPPFSARPSRARSVYRSPGLIHLTPMWCERIQT